jgi:diguanylate cyclase (GGDEF)-like protein
VLQTNSAGNSEAQGFERVVVYLREPETDALHAAAACGIELDDPRLRPPFGFARLERLFDARFETEGCYLLPREVAEAQLESTHGVFRSTRNGHGRWAWQHHWLAVPLRGRDGSCLGVVFADDPVDRLLPTRERLQALRLLADQATVALESVAQYETQRYLAEHDALTTLRNRHAFMNELAAALETVPRNRPLALVYCDLDGFKELNDARGHAAGDEALADFARILVESIRSNDAAFRIGGDEFALLLPGCDEHEAERVVERALESWAAEPTGDVARQRRGASFGIAICRGDSEASTEELLRRADEAMYEAKRTRSRLRVAA